MALSQPPPKTLQLGAVLSLADYCPMLWGFDMDEWDSYDHLNYNQFGVSPEDITGLHEASEGEVFYALDLEEESFDLNW